MTLRGGGAPANLFADDCRALQWLAGETLFSLCSRHHRLWGHTLAAQSAEVMFGARRAGTHHDFPSSLRFFVAKTGGTFGDVLEIARERTLLRYYRPFLPETEVQEAADAMEERSIQHLKFRLGLLTSRFRANHPLKVCADCMRQDVADAGWVYWHLWHQYPGVWTCPVHGGVLRVSTIKSTGVERFGWHLPYEKALTSGVSACGDESLEPLHEFGQMVVELVQKEAPDGWLQAAAVQRTLRRRLEARGLLTQHGNLRLAAAAEDYMRTCEPLRHAAELTHLPSTPEEAKRQVGRILRPLRSGTHPLRLLVAIKWLFASAGEFVQDHERREGASTPIDDERSSVEAGKPLQRERLIALLRDGRSNTSAAREVGVSVATAMMWAAAAGLSAVRRPKILTADRRSALIADLKGGADKHDAANQHGLSIPTVTRVLHTEVGLHDAWKAARFRLARDSAREAWKSLVSTFDGAGAKLLRHMHPAAFSWLYRHDRAWLRAHSVREDATDMHRRPVVRWDERDQALSVAVQRAVFDLSFVGGAQRLKLWHIYQAVPDLKPKLRVLGRLPLTRSVLEKALGLAPPVSTAQEVLSML